VAKAERLAAEVAAAKGTPDKKDKGKEKDKDKAAAPPKRVILDAKGVADKLKPVAETARQREYKRAQQIKSAALTGVGPGWTFPKEDKLKEKWDKWDKLYEQQSSDITGLFKDHFETAKREYEEATKKAVL